jgi:hypothetical protein
MAALCVIVLLVLWAVWSVWPGPAVGRPAPDSGDRSAAEPPYALVGTGVGRLPSPTGLGRAHPKPRGCGLRALTEDDLIAFGLALEASEDVVDVLLGECAGPAVPRRAG